MWIHLSVSAVPHSTPECMAATDDRSHCGCCFMYGAPRRASTFHSHSQKKRDRTILFRAPAPLPAGTRVGMTRRRKSSNNLQRVNLPAISGTRSSSRRESHPAQDKKAKCVPTWPGTYTLGWGNKRHTMRVDRKQVPRRALNI